MNHKRTRYLGLLGATSLAILAFIGMNLNRDINSQQPYIPSTRPTQTATLNLSLLGQAFPNPTPTADLFQPKNCTYTDAFWQEHPEAWPEEIEIAGQSITKSQAVLLMQATNSDLVFDLQRVMYVALLNIRYGADRSAIDQTLQKASDWLAGHPSSENLSAFDRTVLNLYLLNLENYNNGAVGPELCPNQPDRSPSNAEDKIRAQLTETQPFPSATPSPVLAVPTLASTPFVPVYERPTPTEPPQRPPSNPPVQPSPTPLHPTATPRPPANTPVPTTSAPTPAPTSQPKPPISTPTFEPPSNTATPEPPTSTPIIEPSKTPKPKPTHKPKP